MVGMSFDPEFILTRCIHKEIYELTLTGFEPLPGLLE
jgi:hypothetical protein